MLESQSLFVFSKTLQKWCHGDGTALWVNVSVNWRRRKTIHWISHHKLCSSVFVLGPQFVEDRSPQRDKRYIMHGQLSGLSAPLSDRCGLNRVTCRLSAAPTRSRHLQSKQVEEFQSNVQNQGGKSCHLNYFKRGTTLQSSRSAWVLHMAEGYTDLMH